MIGFIKREWIYIWMVIFIVGVNLLNAGYAAGKNIPDKKGISSSAFEDMGVTEEKIKTFFESKKPSAIFFRYGLLAGLFIFFLGMAMNLIFIFSNRKIMPDGIPGKAHVAWGILDVARAVVTVVFLGYALSAAAAVISKAFHFNIDTNLRMIFGTFFIDIIAGAVILYFALVKYKERLSSLGIGLSGFYKNAIAGIMAYVFIFPILIVALIVSMLLLNAIGYKQPPQPVFDIFIEEKRNSMILFLAIFVAVLGPIIEEIFFRGFLYSALKKHVGIFAGVAISGALFSALHANLAGFLPIMILGVLMAFLYETTGSLITSISVHILHNSIILGFVFFIKELLK